MDEREVIQQPHGLVSVLNDKSARLDERDDAAIYLGAYDDAIAIEALIEIASDPEEPDMVRGSCGESIAEIWHRNDAYSEQAFAGLTTEARAEIEGFFRSIASASR